MKIGNNIFKYGLSLAPLAGYTGLSMRTLAAECGAEWCVSEMISAKAITYGDKKTLSLAKIGDGEGPVALQIFGSEPEVMGKGAYMLLSEMANSGTKMPFAVDINMGCPVKKVFSNGEGSALMQNPALIYKIVKSVKDNIDLPVTVKIRAGVDEGRINAPECAMAAEAGGAAAICVHGRTRVQMYGGSVDREVIKNVKNSVHIPVIANGDIRSAADALLMLEYTGADGIAIGRGAVGNPFVFGEVLCALCGEEYVAPSLEKRKEAAMRHIRLAVLDKGERAIPECRGAIAAYFTSFSGASLIRADINRASSLYEVENIIDKINIS